MFNDINKTERTTYFSDKGVLICLYGSETPETLLKILQLLLPAYGYTYILYYYIIITNNNNKLLETWGR